MDVQVATNLFSWGDLAPFTNRIHAVDESLSIDIQTHWSHNSNNNNLCTVIYNNSEPLSSRSIPETENSSILSYNNGINIDVIDCDSSDYESSIDDDEEAYERFMMEDTQTNHEENENVSMDITDFPETSMQNEVNSESNPDMSCDESSNYRFKSPLPPRVSSLPETSQPQIGTNSVLMPSNQVSSQNDANSIPLCNGCEDHWSWNPKDKSHEVRLNGPNSRIAHFHPNWSNGTAGVRGTRILNGGRYYWEVNVSQRIFGTSMMFGIGTKRSRLHVDSFVNMLGEDELSWGLSHKGYIWSKGTSRQYTKPFRENVATTIGIYFDGVAGTLTYFKDFECLGIAFTGLNEVTEPLYPMICSTAAKTEMSLGVMKREFMSMQDRCRATIIRNLTNERQIEQLQLPKSLKRFIAEGLSEHGNAADDLALTQNNIVQQRDLLLPNESSP